MINYDIEHDVAEILYDVCTALGLIDAESWKF
jgi:hypothetical protein